MIHKVRFSFRLLAFTTAFALSLTGCGAVEKSEANESLPGEMLQVPAPKWSLLDTDGKTVSSSDFAGKVLVVDFWATWCPPCRAEIPGYIELQKKYGDKLAIVGISLDQGGPDVVKRFAKEQGVNYTLVMGTDEVVQAFGGVEGIPTTFIIDKDGQLRHKKVGGVPHETYEKILSTFLK